MSAFADDYYLKVLRTTSHALDHLASVVSGRGRYDLANQLWAVQGAVDRERREARASGMKYREQLPEAQRW